MKCFTTQWPAYQSITWCNYHAVNAIFYRHENSNGFYRVSAYFLSKVLMDLIPLRLLFVPVYSAIAYWMVGKLLSAASLLSCCYACVMRYTPVCHKSVFSCQYKVLTFMQKMVCINCIIPSIRASYWSWPFLLLHCYSNWPQFSWSVCGVLYWCCDRSVHCSSEFILPCLHI